MSALRFAARILGFLGLAWAASLAFVFLWSRRDAARPADAIVVLGAAQYAGHPSPVLRARLDHALVLWREGLAPRLILTGGIGTGDTTSEAAVSRRYVVRRGVPDSVIMLEHDGRTTRQSLAAVASLMHEQRLRSAIMVSDPFHMLRLEILSRSLGMEPVLSPTPTSPISANRIETFAYLLSESVKVPFTLVASFFQR